MQKLLTLPENLVSVFHQIENVDRNEWFVCSDPRGSKVGSGGGTANLLYADWKTRYPDIDFSDYISGDKKIIIHAGGQGRRLPAYAPSGKILSPVPIFRWSKGQKIDQTLLDLQVPLYEKILCSTSSNVNCLIASGDVMITAPKLPSSIPDVDVVCFGLWVEPYLASRHGVFFIPRNSSQSLNFMLQKPTMSEIEANNSDNLFLMDIGIWLLSDKAIEVLMQRSGWNRGKNEFKPTFYDLYSTFGLSLGINPIQNDPGINDLLVSILPLEGGEFYHYGTSLELITSTEKIQNRIKDQRAILHHRVKSHPSLFVQNAITEIPWESGLNHIWIENSHIGSGFKLSTHHILTGIPENNWQIELSAGICIDIIPIGESEYCIRPYGMDDLFNGNPKTQDTLWMGQSVLHWCDEHQLKYDNVYGANCNDIQKLPLFPVVKSNELDEGWVKWMIYGGESEYSELYQNTKRISAEQINNMANLSRLEEQRRSFREKNLGMLYQNYQLSIFYQSDLKNMAIHFAQNDIPVGNNFEDKMPDMLRIKDYMFHSELNMLRGDDHKFLEESAFRHLRQLIVEDIGEKQLPVLDVYPDQIVWSRSPVRLDLAGGWSDTPPYCIENGGQVVNIAVDLNGQPPLQVFVRLSDQPNIVIRSIDNGVSETISTWEELSNYNSVGSPFSIPKVALCLSGFYPDYCQMSFSNLKEQLISFGGGLEISLLAAVPKGSGLGTSSILAGTIFGALSDFCRLGWDKNGICHKTLILEQLLTTGGGWQDQYGGIIGGIKLLESESGLQKNINIRWLPDQMFSGETGGRWLLYYTGVTRVAKNILSDIVRGMFLNDSDRLNVLNQIKSHAIDTYEAIQGNDYDLVCRMINKSWKLNNQLDSGTKTEAIQEILERIEDLTIGYKLLGAGGGGYLLIGAKDIKSANKIKEVLNSNPPNKNARFVDFSINNNGLQVTRS